jgi:hypothetical protein
MLSAIHAKFRKQTHCAECHYAECRDATSSGTIVFDADKCCFASLISMNKAVLSAYHSSTALLVSKMPWSFKVPKCNAKALIKKVKFLWFKKILVDFS